MNTAFIYICIDSNLLLLQMCYYFIFDDRVSIFESWFFIAIVTGSFSENEYKPFYHHSFSLFLVFLPI